MVASNTDNLRRAHDTDITAPRITVTDVTDGPYGSVLDAQGAQGFDRGYRVAVTEAIASILPAAEAFLREHPEATPETREALYRFERFLARRLDDGGHAVGW